MKRENRQFQPGSRVLLDIPLDQSRFPLLPKSWPHLCDTVTVITFDNHLHILIYLPLCRWSTVYTLQYLVFHQIPSIRKTSQVPCASLEYKCASCPDIDEWYVPGKMHFGGWSWEGRDWDENSSECQGWHRDQENLSVEELFRSGAPPAIRGGWIGGI